MPTGQRSYFQNPFEHNGDVSHASIFLVVLVLLVGVAAILFYGSAGALSGDPSSLVPANLSGSLPQVASAATSPDRSATPAPAPTAAAPAGQAAPAAQAIAPAGAATTQAAQPAQTPAAAGAKQAVVVNAGGAGVFLRRTPNPNDRLLAWPDGTAVQLLGDESDGGGTHWVKVRDPRGNVGWLPSQNVQSVGG